MRRMKSAIYAGLLLGLVLAGGCVSEAHRRIEEGIRVRGERIAAAEALPPEVRQDGADIAAGAKALQRRVLPPPATPVSGTTEEMQADIQRAGMIDATVERIKGITLGLLDKLSGMGGVAGGIGGVGLAAAGWLIRQRKRIEEAGNRIASKYREYVPAEIRAQVDGKLSEALGAVGLPKAQADKFVAWEHTPD